MKLINLEELQQYPIRYDSYDKEHGSSDFVSGAESVIEFAENLPVYDREVEYAEWIWSRELEDWVCSNCRAENGSKEHMIYRSRGSNYCPDCGRAMRRNHERVRD